MRPALSIARTSTACLPSGRLRVPDAGKSTHPLLSKLYWKVDNPEPGNGSDEEALRTAVVYQLFEPVVPLRDALSAGF